jgi:Ca-activated chloride channel family protein
VELTWNGGETGFRWPWLVPVLVLLVVGLMVWWTRSRGRRTAAGASYVAHAARLRALPRYRALVRRQVVLGTCLTVAALVACAGAIVLGGRVQERQTHAQEDRTRDIMLCLDSSGSMAEVDAEVVREFRTIVGGLRGERVGLTIWSGVAITVFPLTDDYDYVLEQLGEAEDAFGAGGVYSEAYSVYTAGTVIDWDIQSQLGDGLASCVQRFDRRDEDRSRAIVLASDNEPIGQGVYDLPGAAELAREANVVVHAIAPPTTGDRPSAARLFSDAATSTGGTFSMLGDDGSAAGVIKAIGDLDTSEIERPPVVQVLDRPRLGTVLAGIGVGGLGVVWLAQGLLAVRDRREEEAS